MGIVEGVEGMRIYIKILTWIMVVAIAFIFSYLIKSQNNFYGLFTGLLVLLGYYWNDLDRWIDRRFHK
ncbi:hypothetical protein KA005_14900 [bacterium]|nr:hypothetical protein [bacterium]